MALRLADVLQKMKAVFTDDEVHELDVEPTIFALASDFLLAALARSADHGRIAILMKPPDADLLAFVHPRHLARGNTIPIDKESIAGRVVLGGKPVVENDLSTEPHRDIYERIPDEKGRVVPFQKMVAAPLPDGDGEILGVIEVSRVGETRAEAGDDFVARDGQNLGKCCRAFAPYILRAWKP